MTTETTLLARIRRFLRRVHARRRPISWWRAFLAACGLYLIFNNMEVTGSALAVAFGVAMLIEAIEDGRQ